MIKRISHVNVFVLDQERAKQFYTETLGFEARNDAVLDGFRWLTVGPKGQPDLACCSPTPRRRCSAPRTPRRCARWSPRARWAAAFSRPTTAGRLRRSQARGVTFLQEPADRPYGIEALFRDDSGNWFSLTQSKYDAAQYG